MGVTKPCDDMMLQLHAVSMVVGRIQQTLCDQVSMLCVDCAKKVSGSGRPEVRLSMEVQEGNDENMEEGEISNNKEKIKETAIIPLGDKINEDNVTKAIKFSESNNTLSASSSSDRNSNILETAKREAMEEKSQALKSNLSEMEKENDQLEQRIAELQRLRESLLKKEETESRVAEECEKQLKQVEGNIQQVEVHLKQARDTMNWKNGQLLTLKRKENEEKNKLSAVQNELDEFENKLKEQDAKIVEKRAALGKLEQRECRLNEKCKDLEGVCQRLKDNISELETKNKDLFFEGEKRKKDVNAFEKTMNRGARTPRRHH